MNGNMDPIGFSGGSAAVRPKRVIVGGIPVDILDRHQWVDLLLRDRQAKADGGPTKVVTTANGQVVSLFAVDKAYREAVLAADHIAADGMSVVHASRRTSTSLPERVSTTDWFHDAARAAVEHGLKFYMLGATEEVNQRAVARAQALHPGLQVVGSRNGYFKDADIEQIAADIAASKADILWLAIGNPRQAIVAQEFKRLLPELTWVRTCGGLFDFLAGERPRAPLILQNMGLEWAWRVAMEPRRLLWRYLSTNVHSSYLMAMHTRAAGE